MTILKPGFQRDRSGPIKDHVELGRVKEGTAERGYCISVNSRAQKNRARRKS